MRPQNRCDNIASPRLDCLQELASKAYRTTMLRVASGAGRRRLTGYYSRHQFSGAPSTLSRSFFSFGSKGDDGENNGNSEASGSDGNGDDSNSSNDGGSSESTPAEFVPAKLKYGDEAPRYPHTLALPLVNKPLFPGVFTSVTVSDKVGAGGIVLFELFESKRICSKIYLFGPFLLLGHCGSLRAIEQGWPECFSELLLA